MERSSLLHTAEDLFNQTGRMPVIHQVLKAAGIAGVLLGCASVFSGVGCAAGTSLCPISSHRVNQQMLFASVPLQPTSTVLVNSRTGAALVMRRPTALQASRGTDGPQITGRQRAAQLAITGLLSAAAAAHPAVAAEADDRLAELMKAWNEEYGAEFGQWDMSGYRFNAKAQAVAPPVNMEQGTQVARKEAPKLDPIDQVMAEWNKEYGNQYGTWDMSGYRPAKKEAPAVPLPAPVAPIAPKEAPAPPKAAQPAPAPPAAIKVAPPAEPPAPPALVPVVPAPKVAPAPVPQQPIPTSEESGVDATWLVVGGLALLAAGVAAIPKGIADDLTSQAPPPQPPSNPEGGSAEPRPDSLNEGSK